MSHNDNSEIVPEPETAQKTISSQLRFPLPDMDKGICDLILEMPDATSKWPAFSAIRHINRAWIISEIDPQMALFRAVTAEEEAATALFLSIKRKGYRGAERLKKNDHTHKNAVIPFIEAMSRVIARVRGAMPETEMLLIPDEKRLDIRIRLSPFQEGWLSPVPPLHFSLSGGFQGQEMKPEDFSDGVKEIVDEVSHRNISNIIECLKDRANFRNRLLYAGPYGCPAIEGDVTPQLEIYRRNVFILLRAYMLIDPYPGTQLFVQQSLNAFLKMLNQLPKDLENLNEA